MNKVTIMFCLLLVATSANALTATAQCGLSWEYPVEEEVLVDGFRLYLNNDEHILSSDMRNVSCSALNLISTTYNSYIVAFNAHGESDESNTIRFTIVDNSPDKPENLQLILIYQ